MPTTSIEGPFNNQAVGTGIGDGTNYTAFGQPQRIHENATGASATFATSANRGTLWYNCFNSTQIPTDATINGIELVAGTDFDGSGNPYIGNFGSTGASESATLQVYFYNGTSYSAPLVPAGTAPSGVVFNTSPDSITITGPNKRYQNATVGDDILFGASNSLSGLSWNPSSQDDWGFAVTCIAVNATPIFGVIRGIGLRATYTEASSGATDKTVIGVATPTKVLDLTSTTSIIGL